MDPEIRDRLPVTFPEQLLDAGHSLKALLINEVAWSYKDAIKAIHALADAHYAILGGDVYKEEHHQLVSTYDSWYLNQQELAWEEYVEASRKKALSYIERYYRRNGEKYYYTLSAYPPPRQKRSGSNVE